MVQIKLKMAANFFAATIITMTAHAGWAVPQARAQQPAKPAAAAGKAFSPSKLELNPETFAKFRELARPADNEWRHLKIKWFSDVVAARKKAAQEDKPILVFRTGGAGYNDPLGVC
jgi:hypothetical protein